MEFKKNDIIYCEDETLNTVNRKNDVIIYTIKYNSSGMFVSNGLETGWMDFDDSFLFLFAHYGSRSGHSQL